MSDRHPIDTAPKDRLIKLRYIEHGDRVGQWISMSNGREGWFWGNRFWDERPTHWAELDERSG